MVFEAVSRLPSWWVRRRPDGARTRTSAKATAAGGFQGHIGVGGQLAQQQVARREAQARHAHGIAGQLGAEGQLVSPLLAADRAQRLAYHADVDVGQRLVGAGVADGAIDGRLGHGRSGDA